MAKLEELSKLLVNEIQHFESAVVKLKQLQKQELKVDLRDMNEMMSRYQYDLKEISRQHQRHLERLDYFLNCTRRTHKRIILAVYITIIINLITAILMLIFKIL